MTILMVTRPVEQMANLIRFYFFINVYIILFIFFLTHGSVHHGSMLTLRRLMSYIYGAPILDVSRSHTMTQHSR